MYQVDYRTLFPLIVRNILPKIGIMVRTKHCFALGNRAGMLAYCNSNSSNCCSSGI